MASPIRIDPALIAAAEKAGGLYKRTPPKQIEYWAELGKAVERVLNIDDVLAVLEGLKKIVVEPVVSITAEPDEIFGAVEKARKRKILSRTVSGAPVYYEASPSHPGLLDRVEASTGKRKAGRFINGEFKSQR